MFFKKSQIPDSFDLIDNHLSEFFDEDEILVMHEKESEVVHSDIYIIKPSEDRDYYIMISSGMSAIPMSVPADSPHLAFAEVMILLPSNWNINYEDFADENNYWPIRLLKQLSKYPHLNSTWLGWGHTIPLNDQHPVNHNFHSVLLLDSITFSEEFTTIENEEKSVRVYSAIPLYKEELDYVLREGISKLMEKFELFNVEEVVNIHRINTCVV
jgi:hypothetical protein